VIHAATGQSARELGMGDSLGTIAPGKLADLLILNSDPLQDLGGLRDIAHVIQGGVLVEP
jgi:imidazolonepropionase-like amidohydrolase